MAKTFKSYRRNKRLPVLDTVFGAHSVEDITEAMQYLEQHEPPSKEQDDLHRHHEMTKHTEPERASVVGYTEESYPLNKYLHRKHTGKMFAHDESHTQRLEGQASHLDSVIGKHKAQHDFHVFTGVRRSPTQDFGPDEHTTMHLPAFTSSSTSLMQARKFASLASSEKDPEYGVPVHSSTKHILRIHVPEGHPIMSVKAHSNHASENEMLLPRKLNVRIHHKPTIIEGHNVIWDAHIE